MIKTITNRIFLLNILLIILTFLMSTFWTNLGLTDKQNVLLGFILVIVFGLSVGGLFAGIVERKYKNKNQILGIIGNLILVTLFIITFIFVVNEMMI